MLREVVVEESVVGSSKVFAGAGSEVSPPGSPVCILLPPRHNLTETSIFHSSQNEFRLKFNEYLIETVRDAHCKLARDAPNLQNSLTL